MHKSFLSLNTQWY